ncbi:MarC family protein [Porphyromonas canoris]|uniref:UPF0056 membrane protein n=1 Tax=Porphyromonas canoris TaxID=36875 RepID=A0ABR4XL52_9PORP|nr:MarC family protein [Porphyromonas canoris]KGN92600.1 hypothetical protein HQ43_05020 [Porphyromonas canoris]
MEVFDGGWGFFLICIVSLVTISNPLAVMPFYLSLTNGLTQKAKGRVIVKAITASIVTLLFFAFLGPLIFKVFGISIDGFRIIGGIIFFNLGYAMMNDAGSRRNSKLVEDHDTEKQEDTDNISIIPLAIPILCGPGMMTNGILLREEADTNGKVIILVGTIILFYISAGLILRTSERITVWLGETGNKVLSRIMGLILMVIAAEFIITGVKPILTEIIRTAVGS